MTLDQLIFKLENIRRQAGTGNLQVLFRDPDQRMLYDEIHPALGEVSSDDNLDLYSAFDLYVGNPYVEL